MEDPGKLIDAAEKYASVYDGDDRDCIKTDVINAFYAGNDLNAQDARRWQAFQALVARDDAADIFEEAMAIVFPGQQKEGKPTPEDLNAMADTVVWLLEQK